MISSRTVGQTVTLDFTARKPDGTPVDADVLLFVARPDGTDPNPTIDHVGLGHYQAVVTCNQPGLWTWRWTATGAATTAADGLLRVLAAQRPDLYVTEEELRETLGDTGATPKVNMTKVRWACQAGSRSVDDWCSEAAPGYRKFWLDPAPTLRRYLPEHPTQLLIADVGTTVGLQVTVSGTPWVLDVDYQLGPVNAAATGRAYWLLEALRGQLPVRSVSPSLSGGPDLTTPAAPPVQVLARHGWPELPAPVKTAAEIQTLRLFKRPGAPYGTEGVTDWGPVRIARNDPDISPLLQHYSLGPVFV
jgi:hypothetical protein